ncbi:MAG: RagB/SusD family nutrient uptake outer membrane protein, partial [Chitinophagaceae bacterium]
MKTIKYVFAIAGAILFTGLISCKKEFLQIPVQGALADEILANKIGVDKLLVGAYGQLDGVVANSGSAWEAAPGNWIYGSIAGGDAHKGSFGGDQPAIDPIAKFIADGSNGFFNSKWKAIYNGVSASNSVLNLVARAKDIT